MSAKSFVFVFFVQALVQITLGQCLYRPGFAADTILGAPYGLAGAGYNGVAAGGYGLAGGLINNGLAYNGLAAGFGANALAYDGISAPALEITATSGGALPVSSASPVPPAGIALASDNAYEGALAVAGELPFVGTVAMEGVVPSAGVGAVNHACGNGRNAMISENAAFAPTAYGPAIAPGFGFASGNVFNQGIGAFGPAALSSAAPFGYGAGVAGLGYPVSGAYSGLAPYGGIGEGNVAVAGELPVAGTTAVAGQVPIMGAVSFGGGVPAAGAVSISGACDCGASYLY